MIDFKSDDEWNYESENETVWEIENQGDYYCHWIFKNTQNDLNLWYGLNI